MMVHIIRCQNIKCTIKEITSFPENVAAAGVSPVIRLQLLKVSVSSSGYLYWLYQMEYPSRSKCSQKWGIATVRVSSLEYFLLNSSKTNALLKKKKKERGKIRSYTFVLSVDRGQNDKLSK